MQERFRSENGQIVELFVDHYEETNSQKISLMPKKELIKTYLEGFNDRELGYTYSVRVRAHYSKEPPQDGPSSWYLFEF